MGTIKTALSISKWTPYEDKEFRYEGISRNAKNLIIGKQRQPGASEQYIKGI